ncbi:MAG: 4a-hydroxytetrahydrobiopterin dehydratase [Flavobacteriaceae bacterium]|nr:4a-hydroxytetrahydrobiopterin dehydratase [Flavobacteriaceae bacterium]
MDKLSQDEVVAKLSKLQGWRLKKDAIEKTFTFADFKTAFSAMTRIAFEAETINHHPEWFNVYNKLTITLSTHDANGITVKDFDLAGRIEKAVSCFV